MFATGFRKAAVAVVPFAFYAWAANTTYREIRGVEIARRAFDEWNRIEPTIFAVSENTVDPNKESSSRLGLLGCSGSPSLLEKNEQKKLLFRALCWPKELFSPSWVSSFLDMQVSRSEKTAPGVDCFERQILFADGTRLESSLVGGLHHVELTNVPSSSLLFGKKNSTETFSIVQIDEWPEYYAFQYSCDASVQPSFHKIKLN